MVKVFSNDKHLKDTLSDGSIVTLNKNASITYDSIFSGNTRNVTLQGEAFFNVTPNKSKPFVITVNDVTVKVVGTSFNIKNNKGKTEVIVETGVVEVSTPKNSVVLNANEKVVIDPASTTLLKENNKGLLYKHYRTEEFVCDNTPLWQLVEVLNEAYNTNIKIGNVNIGKLPLTTTFHEESLDNILIIIGQTLNIVVVKDKDQIILQ